MLDVKFISRILTINVLLLGLLSFGTAMSIVSPSHYSTELATIEPVKQAHAQSTTKKIKMIANTNNLINITCAQLASGEISIRDHFDANQVRIQGQQCKNNYAKFTFTQVKNNSNNYNATVFPLAKNKYTTDYIYLEKGKNIVEIKQVSGKKIITAKLIINKN